MSTHSRDFKIGVFMLLTVGLFIASLFVIGSERQIFGFKHKYFTHFSNIQGLFPGAPVRLGGITIGRVGEVAFDQLHSGRNIRVTLEVDEDYQSYMKSDTTATIQTQGLLGDRYISLTIGSASTLLKDRANIPSEEAPDLSETIHNATGFISKALETMKNIDAILVEFEDKGLRTLIESIGELQEFTSRLSKGEGLLSKLTNSSRLSDKFTSTLDNLLSITQKADQGKGVLAAFLNNDSGDELVKELRETIKNLNNTSKAIHQLIATSSNSEESTELLATIDSLTRNLNKVATAISEGKGTLGALIMDPSLYDNAVEITDTANRNFILREAIRQSLK